MKPLSINLNNLLFSLCLLLSITACTDNKARPITKESCLESLEVCQNKLIDQTLRTGSIQNELIDKLDHASNDDERTCAASYTACIQSIPKNL